MLLRICLFLTIVAGLATAYLGFMPVKQIISDTRQARDDFHSKFDNETQKYNKTAATLKTTKTQLETTTAKLTQTQSDLDTANSKNSDLEKQNTDLTKNLTKETAHADADDQLLEKWRQLPPPEQILVMMSDFAAAKKELAALHDENRILVTSRDDYKTRWERIFGSENLVPVIMPEGLHGTVLAVDPKYDFVVLSIGDQQGVKERGELTVDRKGKLIGKVRVTSVEKDRSIASILGEWKRGEIREGDQVLYFQ